MKRAIILAACALLLAACVTTGGGVRTEWTADVPSGCEKADAAYDAHIMACRVKPQAKACTSANISEANKINAEAVRFCGGQPASTAANVAKIDGLVKRQLGVGRP